MCRAKNACVGPDRQLGSPFTGQMFGQATLCAPKQSNTETVQPETKKIIHYSPKANIRLSQRGSSFTTSVLMWYGCLSSRAKEGAYHEGSGPAAPRGMGITQPSGQGSSRGTRWQGRSEARPGQASKSAEYLGYRSAVHGQAGAQLSRSPSLPQQSSSRSDCPWLRDQGWAEPKHLGRRYREIPDGAGQDH